MKQDFKAPVSVFGRWALLQGQGMSEEKAARVGESFDELETWDLIEEWVYHELQNDREVRIKVRGGSMRPWIQDGDYVQLSPIKSDQVRVGQVIVAWRAEALSGERLSAMHRVIYCRGERIITKGDSLVRFDELIDRAQVIGRVTHTMRVYVDQSTRRWLTLRGWICLGWGWPLALFISLALSLIMTIRDKVFPPAV